jgi:hypothetical protein
MIEVCMGAVVRGSATKEVLAVPSKNDAVDLVTDV